MFEIPVLGAEEQCLSQRKTEKGIGKARTEDMSQSGRAL